MTKAIAPQIIQSPTELDIAVARLKPSQARNLVDSGMQPDATHLAALVRNACYESCNMYDYRSPIISDRQLAKNNLDLVTLFLEKGASPLERVKAPDAANGAPAGSVSYASPAELAFSITTYLHNTHVVHDDVLLERITPLYRSLSTIVLHAMSKDPSWKPNIQRSFRNEIGTSPEIEKTYRSKLAITNRRLVKDINQRLNDPKDVLGSQARTALESQGTLAWWQQDLPQSLKSHSRFDRPTDAMRDVCYKKISDCMTGKKPQPSKYSLVPK